MTRARWRRWKLWHLSALVAGSAVVLSLATQVPDVLRKLVLVGLLLAPPILVASAWDRYLRRRDDKSLPPVKGFDAVFTRGVWFVVFVFCLIPYYAMIAVLAAAFFD